MDRAGEGPDAGLGDYTTRLQRERDQEPYGLRDASLPGCLLSPRQSPSSVWAKARAEESPAWATFAWSESGAALR